MAAQKSFLLLFHPPPPPPHFICHGLVMKQQFDLGDVAPESWVQFNVRRLRSLSTIETNSIISLSVLSFGPHNTTRYTVVEGVLHKSVLKNPWTWNEKRRYKIHTNSGLADPSCPPASIFRIHCIHCRVMDVCIVWKVLLCRPSSSFYYILLVISPVCFFVIPLLLCRPLSLSKQRRERPRWDEGGGETGGRDWREVVEGEGKEWGWKKEQK